MASTPSSLIRAAVRSEVVWRRTASIHCPPVTPLDVPPAPAMAVQTAAYPGCVKLSTVNESNTGPASAEYCSADFRPSRCAHRVGSRGSGRLAPVWAGAGVRAWWAARSKPLDPEPPLAAGGDFLA